ncbi:MAG: hypothetical protein ACJA0U_002213 [Salibacteraceae bacterium]
MKTLWFENASFMTKEKSIVVDYLPIQNPEILVPITAFSRVIHLTNELITKQI